MSRESQIGAETEGLEPDLQRRRLLAAIVSGTGLATAGAAAAQVMGVMPEGGIVPFRRPLGSLPYLDRKSYTKNMEIVSEVDAPRMQGGEPLMGMWAKGPQRMIPCIGGWIDITDARKPEYIKTGYNTQGVVYSEKLKKWVGLESGVAPMFSPQVEYPRGILQPEIAERHRNYKGLRGIRVRDVTDPLKANVLGEFSTGTTGHGTHMNFYDGGRYAYLDAGWGEELRSENQATVAGSGMMVVDLSDPARIQEVSRWHFPGSLKSEEEEYRKDQWWAGSLSAWSQSHGGPSVPVRVEDGGRYGYGGFGHFGMVVFDFQDIRNPKAVGVVRSEFQGLGAIPFHTCMPITADARHPQLRNLVVGVCEPLDPDCRESAALTVLADVSSPSSPRIMGIFPFPKPAPDAPYSDFCMARGRKGYHNTQIFVAPGQARPEIVVLTAFNAGVRVFNISDPTNIREIAYFVPPKQGDIENYRSWYRGDGETVVIEWDRNMIWLGTPAKAYGLSCPELGAPKTAPQKITRWTMPHHNRGWDG